MKKTNDKGIRHYRVNDNPREMAFYEQWEKENEPDPRINSGHGILQDLFITNQTYDRKITKRDREIAGTVIQWLGSNVGMAFLSDSFKRFGKEIKW